VREVVVAHGNPDSFLPHPRQTGSLRQQNHPPGANLPYGRTHQSIQKFSVSECQSEEPSNSDLRPQYIRTASNRFYEIKYHDTRNDLVKSKAWLLQSSELAAGQYVFPFSLKTHASWPGSFSSDVHERKANVVYHLRAAVEPVTPHFQFEATREIILHEKRP
jgi:hypothetical protein